MKAVVLEKFGSADDLRVVDLPEPKVAPGEVLIRVKAAGVNPVDWKLAAGYLDPIMETGFPLIPGWDVAGVVERVGLDSPEFAVGDEVYGYARKDWAQNGTYAELVSANVRMLAKKPSSATWEQAAGVPLAGLTAYQAIKRAGVTEGDTVLVHAAAGGVGSFGVQIAVALGARVIGTASERNHDFLRSLGAEPVSYGEGLADRVRALAPEGVDAALDFVGSEEAVETSFALAGRADRVVSIAGGRAQELGGHVIWVRPDAADLATLAELVDAGKMTIHVDKTLPLEQAAEAWRLSATGRTRGKIVLTV